jgi:hypothetical protein
MWRLPPHIPLWYAQRQLYLYTEELTIKQKYSTGIAADLWFDSYPEDGGKASSET